MPVSMKKSRRFMRPVSTVTARGWGLVSGAALAFVLTE
jgi:hypothetical protein